MKSLFKMNADDDFDYSDYDDFYTNMEYATDKLMDTIDSFKKTIKSLTGDVYESEENEENMEEEFDEPDEECYIRNHHITYYENDHKYYVDGMEVMSATNLVKLVAEGEYWDNYKNINPEVLRRAAEKGTRLHKEIEDYETKGKEGISIEFKNYKKIKSSYDFDCIENEQIVLYCDDNDEPLFCGHLDMVIEMDGERGIADIKRTSSLYPEKVQFQLNLYRLAYMQSYEKDIDFLRCIRLRENVSEFKEFDIDVNTTIEYIKEYYPNFDDYYSINDNEFDNHNEEDVFEEIEYELYYNDIIVDDIEYTRDDILDKIKNYAGEDIISDDISTYFDDSVDDLLNEENYVMYNVNICIPRFLKTKVSYVKKIKCYVKLLTNLKLLLLDEDNYVIDRLYDYELDELEEKKMTSK